MIQLLSSTGCNFKERRKHENFTVACSGGFDSMAALHFFVRGGWTPYVVHVDHGTGNSGAVQVVSNFCKAHGLCLMVIKIDPNKKQASESWEEFWRNERLKIFNAKGMAPVVTGHNLNDAMETWLFSSINGQSKLIPYNTRNVYRPFLLTPKADLLQYCTDNEVVWYMDKSNDDTRFMRNKIRHNLMPQVFTVNKGFDTMIRKKYLEKYRE